MPSRFQRRIKSLSHVVVRKNNLIIELSAKEIFQVATHSLVTCYHNLYLLGLAPKSFDLTPGKICLEIISSRASKVLSTLIFPLKARISIPPVLRGREWYIILNDTNTQVYSPVSRQRVLCVQLHLAVLVHLRLVLRHRLHIKEVTINKGN